MKEHIAGRSNLEDQIKVRVAASRQRARLYPILADCFLDMWSEKMRWRNEPFEFVPQSVKAQLVIKELGAIVKIENTVAVRVWDGSHRVIYPYFYDEPPLRESEARLGFWALKEALSDYRVEDFRIVDMQRRAYFRPSDVNMTGNERKPFLGRYELLLREWKKLRDER